MSRIISNTRSLLRHSLEHRPLISLSFNRYVSFKPQLIEIELDSSSSSSSASVASSTSPDGGSEMEAIKKLEDMIHRIIVQKSTPDWLPFIPGSSFWVPPRRRSHTVVDLVSKLTNELTEEESLSLATLRGWPCSSFLLKGIKYFP